MSFAGRFRKRVNDLHLSAIRQRIGRFVLGNTEIVQHQQPERTPAEEALLRQTRQMETLREIWLELAAEFDLDVLLGSITRRAGGLIGGSAAGIYFYRPDEDVLEWSVRWGEELAPLGTRLQRGEGLSGQVWAQGRSLVVDDYSCWSGRSSRFESLDYRATVAAPIQWRGEFLGVLDVLSDQAGVFSQADAELLELFAVQSAVAIKNARLFEEERTQRLLAEALAEAAAAMNSSLKLQDVLDRLLEQVMLLTPCDAANIMLIEGGEARIVGWRGYDKLDSEDFISQVSYSVQETASLRWITANRQALVIPDTRAYGGWIEFPETAWLHSYIGTPILVQGEVVGVLRVDSQEPGHFGDEHTRTLQAIAYQVASALQNAQIYQDLQQQRDELELAVLQRTEELQARIGEVEHLNRAMTNVLEDLRQANRLARENAHQLGLANAELETFAYSVSHDLRAPLRAINGFAQILDRRHVEGLNPEGRRYLGNIIKAGEHMGRLIDSLLEYSRIGRRALRRQPVDLGELLATLAETLGPRLAERGARLDLPADSPVVWGDWTLLARIFMNLFDNALIYCAPDRDPHIQVRWEEAGETAIVRVADNGIGIPEEYQAKIFNVFQRLHSEEDYPGTGIGLAVVQKSAKLLGGEISVQSEVDAGSTFSLKLPLATE